MENLCITVDYQKCADRQWYKDVIDFFTKYLDAKPINPMYASNLGKEYLVFLSDHEELNRIADIKAAAVSFTHSSWAIPFVGNILQAWDSQCYTKMPVKYLTATTWLENLLKSMYPGCDVSAVGPVYNVNNSVPSAFKYAAKTKWKNLVVAGSRILHAKNINMWFYIAMLYPGKKFVFCFSEELPQEIKQWLPKFPNVIVEQNCNRNKFQEWLAKAEYYLHYSFYDTFSVSLLEAALLRCKIIMPDFDRLKDAPFRLEWIKGGFSPYSFNNMWASHSTIKIDEGKINPQKTAARIELVLESYRERHLKE